MLVGGAVLAGMPDRNGESINLPDAVRELFFATARFRVEVKVAGDRRWRTDHLIYPDYWDATVWAMVLLEQGGFFAEDVRVRPAEPEGV